MGDYGNRVYPLDGERIRVLLNALGLECVAEQDGTHYRRFEVASAPGTPLSVRLHLAKDSVLGITATCHVLYLQDDVPRLYNEIERWHQDTTLAPGVSRGCTAGSRDGCGGPRVRRLALRSAAGHQ